MATRQPLKSRTSSGVMRKEPRLLRIHRAVVGFSLCASGLWGQVLWAASRDPNPCPSLRRSSSALWLQENLAGNTRPAAKANVASARSPRAGRAGAASCSKASGVSGLTGWGAVPQDSKKNSAGLVTASGVSGEGSKAAQLHPISASPEPTPKNAQRSGACSGPEQVDDKECRLHAEVRQSCDLLQAPVSFTARGATFTGTRGQRQPQHKRAVPSTYAPSHQRS